MKKDLKMVERIELLEFLSHYDLNELYVIDKIKLTYLLFEGRRVVIPNRFLRKLDLSEISFENKDLTNTNLSYTNINLNPQKVHNRSLCFSNLEGLNLFDKDFTNVNIIGCNLRKTGAFIDPQKVFNRDVSCANLEGLNLQNMNFDGVNIENTNLKNSGAFVNFNKTLFNSKTIFNKNYTTKSELDVSLMRENSKTRLLVVRKM